MVVEEQNKLKTNNLIISFVFKIHSSLYWAIVCLFDCLCICWGLSPLVSVSHNVSWSPAGLPALPDSWEHSQDSSFSGFCPTHTYYKTPNMKTLEIIHISQKVFVKKYLAETWLNNSNLLGGIILFSTKTHGDHTRARKNENFPDSKIFVAKTFRIKRVNCINFQIRAKYV